MKVIDTIEKFVEEYSSVSEEYLNIIFKDISFNQLKYINYLSHKELFNVIFVNCKFVRDFDNNEVDMILDIFANRSISFRNCFFDRCKLNIRESVSDNAGPKMYFSNLVTNSNIFIPDLYNTLTIVNSHIEENLKIFRFRGHKKIRILNSNIGVFEIGGGSEVSKGAVGKNIEIHNSEIKGLDLQYGVYLYGWSKDTSFIKEWSNGNIDEIILDANIKDADFSNLRFGNLYLYGVTKTFRECDMTNAEFTKITLRTDSSHLTFIDCVGMDTIKFNDKELKLHRARGTQEYALFKKDAMK